MKKLILIILSVITLSACSSINKQSEISQQLGIDISKATEVSNYDTHSGNGDGTSCIVLNFENEDALKQIEENPDWKQFPLDETAKTLAYGYEDETSSIGSFLQNDKGENLIPEIENGYYMLIDRQTDKTDNILERKSFNFTLGIYDKDSNNLYYCKLDT